MATVYKRLGRKYWVAAYFAADGKKIQKSTGQTNKALAKNLAHAWETEEKELKKEGLKEQQQFLSIIKKATIEANKGELTLNVARDFIEELYRLSNRENFPSFTVQTWLDHWLKSKVAHVSKSTMNRDTISVSDIVSALGDIAKKPIALLSTQDCELVQSKFARTAKKVATLNQKMQDFRQALHAAHEQGLVS
ncbi:MAG: hypothetical protein HC845_11805 [Akkermansiaceae bacterium]|nr:hypothetical protein [Akkermansiaceae bacterium]